MTSADTPHPNAHDHLRDLSDTVSIDLAVARWSRISLTELDSLYHRHECLESKRSAVINAIREGRLEWEDVGVVTPFGGVRIHELPLDDLVAHGRVVIKEHSLRHWLEQLGFDERSDMPTSKPLPANVQDANNPAVEMNQDIAIALLARLLAEAAPDTYAVAGRPNAAQIGVAVEARAKEWFGPDVRGFSSFRKKVANALRRVELEMPDRHPY